MKGVIMAVLTREQVFDRLHERIGTDSSEEAIAFLEDMTDTFNDLENKANSSGEDWKRKYEENDRNWKEKYKHRFFNGDVSTPPPAETDENKKGSKEEIKIEDLFKEKEGN